MAEPYFVDDHVTLYHGDMRELVYTLGTWVDAVVTDPPYGETTLKWDSWPHKWPTIVSTYTSAMWCFGSMRMFGERWSDFEDAGWTFSQDIVWEKHNGSGSANDRFRRVHEHATYWYQGSWSERHHDVPLVPYDGPDKRPPGQIHRKSASALAHTGTFDDVGRERTNQRLTRSVIYARSMHGRALHPTEKPAAILDPLIRYSVPVDGVVLDPFAGSGSTLLTARSLGRRAIGIEANEAYCEAAAKRLAEPDLFGGAA